MDATSATADPFVGASHMAQRMRTFDWNTTSLGPVAGWPQSLRSALSICIGSRFPIAIYWGRDLSLLYNDAWSPILGAKHPGALGRPGAEVWPEIWTTIGPMFELVLTTGESTYLEDALLLMNRHGYTEECYFNYTFTAIRGESGETGGIFNAVVETTFRVIAERRTRLLQELGERLAGVKSTAAACTAATDVLARDGADVPFCLVYLLDQTHRTATLCASSGVAPGSPAASERIDLRDTGSTAWPLHAAAETGQVLTVERLTERFGAPLTGGRWPDPAETALIAPLLSGLSALPIGFLVVGVSPRRAVDEEYRQFAARAAALIATAATTVQAYEAERMRAESLAEIDRAKTVFFSNVSHEFRTPLTLLLGPLDDLLAEGTGGLTESHRDILTGMRRNGARLLKLVNALLDFSRIEAGRMNARFEAVDLCALTSDLASTFRSAMERAHLTFTVTCGTLPEPVYVDRDMWEKIVLNLLSNAFKFTLQGSVTVAVEADGDAAVVHVADSGVGIPEAELPRIFDRFHRVSGTAGRSHEGSGIGLALVHELVKLHGGSMTVKSAVGRGTRFTVRVPFGTAHLAPETVARATTPPTLRGAAPYVEEALRWLPSDASAGVLEHAGPSPDAPDVGRILLADDNSDMRDYARRLLGDRWIVEAVGNGRQALDAARARRPDIIVTDVMMPELDGFALLRELRADPELRTVPVIMVSARAGEEARLESLEAGADDYLVKPFSARDLVTRVAVQLIRVRVRDLERRQARRLVGLFTQAPVAIAVLRGPDHVYEVTNPAYLELVGGREVLGLPLQEALPELAGQGIVELLDGVRASRQPFVGRSLRVTLNRGPQGAPEDAYFDFVYQPILDDAGDVDSIVVVAHDVTALASAKLEAENVNRMKDEFLATLSHELRTPLNAVLGYTQMLRGGLVGADRMPAVLETIERNAKLQEQLVSDVLDVSRIITGKMRLDVRPVDMGRVIGEAVETVAPAASAKGVKLQTTVDQPGVPVAGDAQRLQQIVWNLLSNAVKFTPRGGRVQLHLQRVNSHVEITVRDTGEGIAPEFLPYLFQRFRQADSTSTRSHGGLGLGLAICRHLIEAHGGTIEAFSPGKGRGTTMRVQLPLLIVHDAGEQSAERVHPSVELTPAAVRLADLTGLRVLLVDDDADALQMAADALSIAGAAVVTATGADQALEALDANQFDAAVIDIGMPSVDGYELVRRIRQRPESRQGRLPAAALTAYARAVDRTRSLQAGFQLHLSKPVEPAELAAAVLALAEGARAAPDTSR